jgi:dethiobiotin synthetase
VARAGLGTINHTLLTLHAARSAGLEVAGVVVNRYQVEPAVAGATEQGDAPHREDADLAMYTNPQQIAERGRVKVLALVPDEPASSVETDRLGPDVRFAIGQTPWLEMLNRADDQ